MNLQTNSQMMQSTSVSHLVQLRTRKGPINEKSGVTTRGMNLGQIRSESPAPADACQQTCFTNFASSQRLASPPAARGPSGMLLASTTSVNDVSSRSHTHAVYLREKDASPGATSLQRRSRRRAPVPAGRVLRRRPRRPRAHGPWRAAETSSTASCAVPRGPEYYFVVQAYRSLRVACCGVRLDPATPFALYTCTRSAPARHKWNTDSVLPPETRRGTCDGAGGGTRVLRGGATGQRRLRLRAEHAHP